MTRLRYISDHLQQRFGGKTLKMAPRVSGATWFGCWQWAQGQCGLGSAAIQWMQTGKALRVGGSEVNSPFIIKAQGWFPAGWPSEGPLCRRGKLEKLEKLRRLQKDLKGLNGCVYDGTASKTQPTIIFHSLFSGRAARTAHSEKHGGDFGSTCLRLDSSLLHQLCLCSWLTWNIYTRKLQ